jgi:hypothetical protein
VVGVTVEDEFLPQSATSYVSSVEVMIYEVR